MEMVEQVAPNDSFARLVAPSAAALLVVDVQNDFCHEEGGFGKLGVDLGPIHQAVTSLLRLIDEARRVKLPVIFIRTHHDESNNSEAWLTRSTHRARGKEICETGSWGAEFYRVQPSPNEVVIIKHRYSGFVGTTLEVVLRSLQRRSVLVTGVATNVCVESTARDAFMRDYHVVVVEDCTAAATKEEHDASHHNIRRYFGRVVDSEHLFTLWKTWQ
jgi:ureidoacrylate peracid hydrolase